MSITININNDKQVSTFTVMGEISYEDVIATLKEFWQDKPTLNVLWDFRKGSMVQLSSADLEKIIDFVKVHAKKRAGGKSAFAVSKDLDYGLSRMLEAFASGEKIPLQTAIFRSFEEAMEWINKKQEE